jgi:hypothetical protein
MTGVAIIAARSGGSISAPWCAVRKRVSAAYASANPCTSSRRLRDRTRAAARASGDPRLQVELAELPDVVGVEVGVEDGADRLAADPPERERPPAPRTRVDDPHATAGEDRRARLSAIRGRDRRRRAAEEDAHRVGARSQDMFRPMTRPATRATSASCTRGERSATATTATAITPTTSTTRTRRRISVGGRERAIECRTRRLVRIGDRAGLGDVAREEGQDAGLGEDGVEPLAPERRVASEERPARIAEELGRADGHARAVREDDVGDAVDAGPAHPGR